MVLHYRSWNDNWTYEYADTVSYRFVVFEDVIKDNFERLNLTGIIKQATLDRTGFVGNVSIFTKSIDDLKGAYAVQITKKNAINVYVLDSDFKILNDNGDLVLHVNP